MKTYNVVSIISVLADDPDAAAEIVREHVSNEDGSDTMVTIYVEEEQERASIGQVATKALIGLARAFNRTLVIRCDNQFRPYVMDYPQNGGRPYEVSLNVSEVVGHYKEHNNV